MITIDDIKVCTNIHLIPKDIHVNKNLCFDHRLLETLDNPKEDDYKYDFDVFLPKYGINLQRPYVWEHYQQNEFILSILLEKPIDPFIIVQEYDGYNYHERRGTNRIIDGKQRLMTIQKFVHNEFPIIVNGQAAYWSDFDDKLKLFFKSRCSYLTATVYYSYPDTPVTDDMKIILFNYYNFSGTPQTEAHKNMLQKFLKI